MVPPNRLRFRSEIAPSAVLATRGRPARALLAVKRSAYLPGGWLAPVIIWRLTRSIRCRPATSELRTATFCPTLRPILRCNIIRDIANCALHNSEQSSLTKRGLEPEWGTHVNEIKRGLHLRFGATADGKGPPWPAYRSFTPVLSSDFRNFRRPTTGLDGHRHR